MANKSVYGFTLAKLRHFSEIHRLNENKRFFITNSIHKNKWAKSNLAQQWKVKQSKRVKGYLRGRSGEDGKRIYVPLHLHAERRYKSLFVFSKGK